MIILQNFLILQIFYMVMALSPYMPIWNMEPVGIRLAQNLGIGAQWDGFLKIYAPKKEGQLDMTNPGDGFVVDSLNSPGVLFAVKQANMIKKKKKNYIITSISFARNLFGQQGMLSDLELRLKPVAIWML